MEPNERQIEELLEKAWLSWEGSGSLTEADFVQRCNLDEVPEPVTTLERLDLVRRRGDKLEFTAEGRRRAELVIRHHRLAERLLRDVLQVRGESFESSACAFEHCLDREVSESVCTLLGHPRSCPHGKAIPAGPCCAAAARQVRPIIICLRDLPVGRSAKVAYISSPSHKRLDQVTAVGLLPGATIQVHQRSPAFVLDVGQTSLALDEQIVSGIYVRPLAEPEEIENDLANHSAGGHRRRRGFLGRA